MAAGVAGRAFVPLDHYLAVLLCAALRIDGVVWCVHIGGEALEVGAALFTGALHGGGGCGCGGGVGEIFEKGKGKVAVLSLFAVRGSPDASRVLQEGRLI